MLVALKFTIVIQEPMIHEAAVGNLTTILVVVGLYIRAVNKSEVVRIGDEFAAVVA